MYDNLFTPLQIGTVPISNRIVRAAHGTGLGWVDKGDIVAYHEARARGGVGLAILEHGGVHPTSASLWPFYDPSIVEGCTRIVETMHRYDSKLFVQLTHRGSSAGNPLGQPMSASDIPNPYFGVVPVPMTISMIDEIVEAFATAAQHAKDGGIDGVELHGAHGYLIGQFLSPATNRRSDEYGGPVENRVRFVTEVINAIRARVGDGYPIGIRLSSDDGIPGSLRPDDTAQIATLLQDKVDFVDVSIGSYYRWHKTLATMDDPFGYELPTSEIVTRVCDKPTIVTGRIMTLDHASHIVASGQADMVSMVRALIADPELVNKARAGRENEIRPCIGTSQGCVGQAQTTGRLGCVVNVAAGKEATTPYEGSPATVSRRVLVVGGGAAGLEAARTAARRGHRVELHEMTNKLGGQVTIAATAPRRADFGAITRWLADEVERLGVTVHLRSPIDVESVVESGADVTIIATGSVPRRDGFQAARPLQPIPGSDLPHVYSSWDVFGFGGRARVGERAVVFDDTGRYDALSVADALLAAGADVTLVSSHNALGARVVLPIATVAAVRERLYGGAFTFLANSNLEEITPEEVLAVAAGSSRVTRIRADTVVIVGYNEPQRQLADALDGRSTETYVIGDAAGGATLQQAIQDAARVARSI